MLDRFGIRPNSNGLITAPDEASVVAQWIDEDGMRGTRAEPEPYDPLLIVSYPLEE